MKISPWATALKENASAIGDNPRPKAKSRSVDGVNDRAAVCFNEKEGNALVKDTQSKGRASRSEDALLSAACSPTRT